MLNFSSLRFSALLFWASLMVGSCKLLPPTTLGKIPELATRRIHPKAKQLEQRIRAIAQKGYALGHQDAMVYGIDWKNDGTLDRSDMFQVIGDHPAVFGFDIGYLELQKTHNLDTVSFELIKKLIKKAHRKGGIITISWHPSNPLSKGNSWETQKAVKHILKEGKLHEEYKKWLSILAAFFKSLKDDSGQPIPIVFRPFHEMNNTWFWWGKGHCTPKEYIQLWQETITILTHQYQVDQILYAYSPNTFKTKEEYLKYYPGDEFVDLLGVDIYQHSTTENFIKALQRNLSIMAEIAKEKNLPCALTEVGLNETSVANWWTTVLDQHVADKGIAWALFWRNVRKNHYFVPYPGQKSCDDFKKLKERPHVLSLQDIIDIK